MKGCIPVSANSFDLARFIGEEAKKDSRFKDGYIAEVYGPFGIRAYSCIFVIDPSKKSGSGRDGEIVGSLTIEGTEGGYLYETGEVINRFPEGSIGYMNNMNNVVAKLPVYTEEVLDLLFQTGIKKGYSGR